MSVAATTWAWKLLEDGLLEQSIGFVLVAVADFADNDGHCWPSQAKIMSRTRYGESTVYKALKSLEERGLLHREGQWRRGPDGKTVGSDGRGRLPDAIWLHVGARPADAPILPELFDPDQTMRGRVFSSKRGTSEAWEQDAWADTPPGGAVEVEDTSLSPAVRADDYPYEVRVIPVEGAEDYYPYEVRVIPVEGAEDYYPYEVRVITADQPVPSTGINPVITRISRQINPYLTPSLNKEEPSINHQSIPVHNETGVAGEAPPDSGSGRVVDVGGVDPDLVDASMPDALWATLDSEWTLRARQRLAERLAAGWSPEGLYAALNRSLDASSDPGRVVSARIKALPLSPPVTPRSMPAAPEPEPEPERDVASFPPWIQAMLAARAVQDPLAGKSPSWWQKHWESSGFAPDGLVDRGGSEDTSESSLSKVCSANFAVTSDDAS